MYARVAEFDNPRLSEPSLVDELTRGARESSPRWQEALPNAQGHMMLIDRQNGRSLGITFFESEAQIREAQPVFERMGDEMPEETRGKRIGVSSYEVLMAEGGEAAKAARVSTFEGDASRIDEATKTSIENVLPRAQQMPGWKGVFSLADRTSGKVILITLWDSPESMKASEEQGEKLRQENAEAAAGKVTGVDRYEIAFAMTPSEVEALRR
jgi:heme-degrading monooxygenase HmoA